MTGMIENIKIESADEFIFLGLTIHKHLNGIRT